MSVADRFHSKLWATGQIAGMAFTKKDEVHGVSQAPYLSAAMRINFIKTS